MSSTNIATNILPSQAVEHLNNLGVLGLREGDIDLAMKVLKDAVVARRGGRAQPPAKEERQGHQQSPTTSPRPSSFSSSMGASNSGSVAPSVQGDTTSSSSSPVEQQSMRENHDGSLQDMEVDQPPPPPPPQTTGPRHTPSEPNSTDAVTDSSSDANGSVAEKDDDAQDQGGNIDSIHAVMATTAANEAQHKTRLNLKRQRTSGTGGHSSASYMYTRGILMDVAQLRDHLSNVQSANNNQTFRKEDLDMVAEAIQSSTLLYNMALAHHQNAARGGFSGTSSGSMSLSKALRLYSMSLEVIYSAVLSWVPSLLSQNQGSDQQPFFTNGRSYLMNTHRVMVVASLNNMGQISYELGDHDKAQNYFQQALSLLLSDFLGDTTLLMMTTASPAATTTAGVSSALFGPQELVGVIFNTMVLSHHPNVAGAA